MRRTSVALLLGAAALVPTGAARADDYSIHVLGHLQTAWTDNLLSAPEDDDPATLPPESDFYTQISPGALVSYETPRMIHEATYDLDANLYARNDEGYSLQHRAGWRGFFLTGPQSELSTSLGFSTGTTATMSTTQGAGMGTGTVIPGGLNSFWGLEGGQNLSYTATRELRLTQNLRARKFETTDESAMTSSGGSELGLGLGADRGWNFTALAVQASASYVTLDSTGATETTDTINSNALVSVRRDLSPRWNALLDGGAAAVFPLGGDGEIFVQPTIGLNLSYAPNWGAAGLALRRALAPNLYLGENTVTDSAILNASLPTPWLTNDPNVPKLVITGSGGFTRTQTVDTDTGSLQSGFDVVHVDLALQYQARAGLGFALRGQHLRQMAATDVAGMASFDYDRTTVIASVTWRFPDRVAAEIPLRDSLRVDRAGNTPVGEETPASVAPGSP